MSDATPGLELFPDALTRPITFQTASGPGDLCHTRERLEKDPALRKDLSTAWRALIAKEHTYDARLASLLKMLRMKQ